MNRFKVTSILCGGMLSLAGTTLLAQSTDQSPSSSAQSTEQNQTAKPSEQSGALGQSSSTLGQESSAGQAAGQWHHGQRNVRLSDLMNATVESRDGKALGQIRDFTLNPQSGRIDFAILSLSGTAGAESSLATPSTTPGATPGQSSSSALGQPSATSSPATGSAVASTESGKLIPVPWQLFRHSMKNSQTQTPGALPTSQMGAQSLVLNIDDSKLQSAPSFNSSDWSELQQSSFDQQVYSYYGVNRMSGLGTSGGNISGQGAGTYDNDRSAKGGAKDLLQQGQPQQPQENK